VGGVNEVTVSCHHEADERDTHPVLVEEDVRMGTSDEKGIPCELSLMAK
jgi:hypothetical protein